MLITLAFQLPLRLSMTLAALLTVGLLPLAIVKARHSVAFAVMTVAMLALLWRGEGWKAAFLETEEQLSQLPPQCRQLLPRITSVRQDAWPAYGGARRAPQFDWNQSHTSTNLDGYPRVLLSMVQRDESGGNAGGYGSFLVAHAINQTANGELSPEDLVQSGLDFLPSHRPDSLARGYLKNHTQTAATPIDFI
jgi:hypothetical protein